MPQRPRTKLVRRGLTKLARTARPTRPREQPTALVSVVVTVSPRDRDHLDACLQSLEEQSHPQVQVLVQEYGEPGPVSLARARNGGAGQARGAYLMFLDARDRLAESAAELLVNRLEATGSDLAVGLATGADASAVTLAERPEVLEDLALGCRMFRAEFWATADLRFPETDAESADPTVVAASLAARTMDVLSHRVCERVDPGAGLAFGAVAGVEHDLAPWLAGTARVDALLRAPALAQARRAWLRGSLEFAPASLLDSADRLDDDAFAALSATVDRLVGEADPPLWASLSWESRVKLRLAARGRRDELAEFVTDRRLNGPDVRTEVRDGRVHAVLDCPGVEVGDEDRELGEHETPLVASLRQIRWHGTGVLELEVFAFVRFVDSDAPELSATLVAGDRRVPVEVTAHVDPAVDRFARERHQSHQHGSFRLNIAGDALLGESSWAVELSLTADGVTRTGTINHRDHNGTVGERPRRLLDGKLWGPSPAGDGIRIDVEQPAAVLVDGSVSRRTVHGAVAGWADAVAVELVHASGQTVRAPLVVRADHPGFDAALPDIGFGNREDDAAEWQVFAVDGGGHRRPLAFPAQGCAWLEPSPRAAVAWHRGRGGAAVVQEVACRPALTDVRLDDHDLLVALSWLGPEPPRWSLALVGDRVTLPGTLESNAPGQAVVRFRTVADEWGLGETTAPSGAYRFDLRLGAREDDESTGSLVVHEALTERTPVELLAERVRVRVRQTPRRRLVVHLLPPLADDELGPRAQQLQQERYRATAYELDPSAVYLQSYTGQAATDSQFAIHQELRRTRPDLTLYWGVADHSVRLPEGAVPVLIRSREWYDVLGTAAFLVNNIDFDAWFVKRPGQRFLQTFHGYPAKSMGLVQWRAKGFSEPQLRAELERTARKWDLILTPVPEMDEYYRREYAYDGPIHNQGYPRDDVLTSPDADRLRADTRRRLGLADGQVAVLYAPTFRDHLATAHRSAEMAEHADLGRLADALGPGHVLLVRGHRFHAGADLDLRHRDRMVDVTDYPEINHLILAADAAVLDYSSLRFDFALTGKPMVFWVPDLDVYSGPVRGFLFDYRATAPGPQVDSLDEVAAALADLDGLRSAYGERIAEFNAAYQYRQDGHAAERVVAAFWG